MTPTPVAPKASLLKMEPAVIIGLVVTVITVVLSSGLPIPGVVTAILSAIVVMAGAFGIRSKVVPVAKMKP